jgi:exodeoxyribonuclease-5
MFVPASPKFSNQIMQVKERAFLNRLLETFPFTPTVEQQKLLKQLALFTLLSERFELFVLKGYAGTGKTTVVSTW